MTEKGGCKNKVRSLFTKDVALICLPVLVGDRLLLSFVISERTLTTSNFKIKFFFNFKVRSVLKYAHSEVPDCITVVVNTEYINPIIPVGGSGGVFGLNL